MKLKKYLTKKNVIIFSIILAIIILVTILIIFLLNKTTLFKSNEDVKNDIIEMQDNIKDGEKVNIDNTLYNKDVGVSRETLYIKENASSKVKESVQGENIGFEKSTKSENGIIIVEAYDRTEAIEYNVISHTKDVLNIEGYKYSNLCNLSYTIGEVEEKKTIEEGTDTLRRCMIAPNKTYTLTSDFEGGVNTAFFFDDELKFISSTTQKTFTTPENARYIKIITETEDASKKDTWVTYNLVFGSESGDDFFPDIIQTSIDTTQEEKSHLPFMNGKTVVYIDGGEIELKYISK